MCNEELATAPALDEITTLALVENGLLHVNFELDRSEPSFFRVAREAHLLFYRSMIEVLRGSANLAITARWNKRRRAKYQRGSSPWQEIHCVDAPGCTKAWRFSSPEPCVEPEFTKNHDRSTAQREFLIGFYDALAMIQTECFMGMFVHSKTQFVTDEDMRQLEWLHERVRNEYEHFIPKFYSAPSLDLIEATQICVSHSAALLFDSGNVLFHGTSCDAVKNLMDVTIFKLLAIGKEMTKKSLK